MATVAKEVMDRLHRVESACNNQQVVDVGAYYAGQERTRTQTQGNPITDQDDGRDLIDGYLHDLAMHDPETLQKLEQLTDEERIEYLRTHLY